jgi:stage II sporulation protein D
MKSEYRFTANWLKGLMQWHRHSWGLALILWTVALVNLTVKVAPARAEQLELRVAIEQDQNQVVVGSSTAAVVKDGNGRVLEQIPAQTPVVAESDQGRVAVSNFRASMVWIEPANGGYVAIGDQRGTKWYRGRALIVPTRAGLTAVNYVDLEQYLYSVVGSEMPTSWLPEALKAQAIAARSYALFQRQNGANAVFDVGDTARWQVYGGAEQEASSTIAAVDATAGQVLTYNGQIINAVFHSSSGGYTENVEDVWVNALPYLRAVPDYDQSAPVYQWTVNISADRMRQIIPGIGNILSLTPETTTPRGRVVRMQVRGETGTHEIDGDDLRNDLGLKSTLFTVVPEMNQVASTQAVSSAPIAFQITGRGFGHGLGMSQYGAYALAGRGYTYQQIVTHYYTGATLARMQVR